MQTASYESSCRSLVTNDFESESGKAISTAFWDESRRFNVAYARYIEADPIVLEKTPNQFLNVYGFANSPSGTMAIQGLGFDDSILSLYANSTETQPQNVPTTVQGRSVANMNSYGYANQNPIRFIDPTGLTPLVGPPNTWLTFPSGQMRLYGPNGSAAVDIDCHADHGAGTPHAHNWDASGRGPGVPMSLLP